MTAVALGAAIYCESRDWSGVTSRAKATQARTAAGAAIAVALDYEARTAGATARLTATRTAGPDGVTIQVESMLGWSSGRLSLDAPVEMQLALSDPGPNRFRALVFDPQGRPVPDASQEFAVTRAAAASAGIPASQTVGVKVLDGGRNTIETLVPKGALLPLSGTTRFRAASLLRSGGHGMLRLELFQVSDANVLDPRPQPPHRRVPHPRRRPARQHGHPPRRRTRRPLADDRGPDPASRA